MKSPGSTPRLALTAGLALGLLLPPPAVSAQSFGGFLRPTCGRPVTWKAMSVAGAQKVGWMEFYNGTPPEKPRWYLQQSVNVTIADNLIYNNLTCPGESSWTGPNTCYYIAYTGQINFQRDVDQSMTASHAADMETGAVTSSYSGSYGRNDFHEDFRLHQQNAGSCPGPSYYSHYDKEIYAGSGSLGTVNNQPVWSGSETYRRIFTRDCYAGAPCNNTPQTGRHHTDETITVPLSLEAFPSSGAYVSPTQQSLNSTTANHDCNGTATGQRAITGAINLSDEFTTLEMIELADERADLTEQELQNADWITVGSAYTLLNDSEEKVKLRKMWFFFEFDRLPNLAYTITWTEVTVGLDGGVSEVQRSWHSPGTSYGGPDVSPIFEIEQPYYNAVVFVVNERFCPEGAQDDTQCVNPLARSSSPAAAGCCGGSSGLGGAELDGVSLSVSLGSTGYDEDAGTIRLQTHRPDATTPTAAALKVLNPAADTEVINDANGDLAQVKSRQFLGHVRKISNTSVAVHLFPAGQISPTKVNGLYVTNGATEVVARIVAAPLAGQGDFNRITLTETTGPSSARTTQYDYEPANQRWTMLSPDSLLKQRETMAWDVQSQLLTKTYETLDPATSQVTFREARVFHVFGAMDVEDLQVEPNPTRVELVEVRTGVGSEERVSYYYYYDGGQYGQSYLNRTEDWTGRWRTLQRTINAGSGLDRPTVEREGYLDHSYAAYLSDSTLCPGLTHQIFGEVVRSLRR